MITSESKPHTPSGRESNACYGIEYEPTLVEEAVLLAVKDRPEERSFRRERDPIYEIRDENRREIRFGLLHRAWFERLGLSRPIRQAFAERPVLADATQRCFVAKVPRRKDEIAELFVSPKDGNAEETERPLIGIMLRPVSFIEGDGLLDLLRHELVHIVDMLDPAFEYTPVFSCDEDAAIPESAILERYRALWDASVDGRLAREGLASPSRRAQRFSDFAKVFRVLGAQTEEAFSVLFDQSRHTHPQLVAFARAPREMLRHRVPKEHPKKLKLGFQSD